MLVEHVDHCAQVSGRETGVSKPNGAFNTRCLGIGGIKVIYEKEWRYGDTSRSSNTADFCEDRRRAHLVGSGQPAAVHASYARLRRTPRYDCGQVLHSSIAQGCDRSELAAGPWGQR